MGALCRGWKFNSCHKKAICNYCGEEMRGVYENMYKHSVKVCKEITQELRLKIIETRKKANGIDDFHEEESEESIDDLHNHVLQNQVPKFLMHISLKSLL